MTARSTNKPERSSRFGTQPAYELLFDSEYNIQVVSDLTGGMSPQRIQRALHGFTLPPVALQSALSELLNVPASELFTEEARTADPLPRGGSNRRVNYAPKKK